MKEMRRGPRDQKRPLLLKNHNMADDNGEISPPSPTACALFFLLLVFVKIASDIDNGTAGSSSDNEGTR